MNNIRLEFQLSAYRCVKTVVSVREMVFALALHNGLALDVKLVCLITKIHHSITYTYILFQLFVHQLVKIVEHAQLRIRVLVRLRTVEQYVAYVCLSFSRN